MKKLFIFLISSFTTLGLCGQTSSNTFMKLYIDGGTGVANYHGIYQQFGLKGVFKNSWMAGISYYNIEMDPRNLPSDYTAGATTVLIVPIPDEMPTVKMMLINFTGGKFFPLGKKTWFTTEAGISIVTGDVLEFKPQAVSEEWDHISSNYSTTEKSKTTVGGIIKADFTWAITRHFGLGVGAFGNVNSIQSPVGFEFKFLFGALRGKNVGKK